MIEEESMNHIEGYLREAGSIAAGLDRAALAKIVDLLAALQKTEGRIFFLGVGGSAANASHAVNDFRKLCGIEAYTPTDNVSELTARINDDGWDGVFREWLKGSRLRKTDLVFVFSVGGGSKEKNISANLVAALEYAKTIGAKICGIVGRDGGYTAKVADACCLIPVLNEQLVTPHTEAFQAVLWHMLVSHPRLQRQSMKWESTQ